MIILVVWTFSTNIGLLPHVLFSQLLFRTLTIFNVLTLILSLDAVRLQILVKNGSFLQLVFVVWIRSHELAFQILRHLAHVIVVWWHLSGVGWCSKISVVERSWWGWLLLVTIQEGWVLRWLLRLVVHRHADLWEHFTHHQLLEFAWGSHWKLW